MQEPAGLLHSAETPRLWLQELRVEDHLNDYHEIWSNPAALIWSTQEPKKTLGETEAWMEPATRSPSRPWVSNYAILLRPTVTSSIETRNPVRPKMIGTVGAHGLAEVAEGRRGDIGYMINHDYWGKGYATEALEAFLNLHFGEGRPELVAKVDAENWASIRVLGKMAERGYVVRQGELMEGVFKIPAKGLRDMRVWYISKDS